MHKVKRGESWGVKKKKLYERANYTANAANQMITFGNEPNVLEINFPKSEAPLYRNRELG